MPFVSMILLLLLYLTTALGCSGPQSRPQAEHAFALTLHSATADRRYTYFEIDRGGQFSYGGGREGALRQTWPLGQLSPQQQRDIRQLIRDHQLAEARGSRFASAQRVTYHFQFRDGARSRSYRAIDDEVPGLSALHDQLFQIQVQMRYD
jgi:hypothetical protein